MQVKFSIRDESVTVNEDRNYVIPVTVHYLLSKKDNEEHWSGFETEFRLPTEKAAREMQSAIRSGNLKDFI